MSIVLVLLAHLVNDKLFPGGLGVLIFFVISGFLITRLMFVEMKRTGTLHLSNFYKRRMYRLYPAIVAYTLIAVLIFAAGNQAKLITNWQEPASALAYFANYYYAARSVHHVPAQLPFQIFWSLAIEFQFYLMLPTAMLLSKGQPNRVLAVALAAMIVPLALRLAVATMHPELITTFYFYFRTEMRIDSIATGVMIAALAEAGDRSPLLPVSRSTIAAILAAATTLACLAIFRNPFFRETLRYSLLNLSAGVLLCASVFTDRYRWINVVLNWWPIVWIGEVSYSLYVWHEGTANAVRWLLPTVWHPVQITAIFMACFAAAALSYYGIEQPFSKIRAKLLAKSQQV